MTTFSDMVTLMMTFFVLLLTMSTMDKKKLQKTFGFFPGAIGPLGRAAAQEVKLQAKPQDKQLVPSTFTVTRQAHRTLMPIQDPFRMTKAVIGVFKSRGIDARLKTEERDGRIHVQVVGPDAWDDKGALTREAREALAELGQITAQMGRGLSVSAVIGGDEDDERLWSDALDRARDAVVAIHAGGDIPIDETEMMGYGPGSQQAARSPKTRLEITIVVEQETTDGGE